LRLDHLPRDEFNIILVDLYCPLCDLPRCFLALQDMRQWPIRYDSNTMS
jgi:hypothetical protein